MKRTMILTLAAAALALAQPETRQITVSTGAAGGFVQMSQTGSTIQSAPYSATIVNESTQTLADGNRIVQRVTGSTARDSQGRTRQDMALPSIGNMSAANAPHLVFIQDPVAQAAYTLNLTDKTAHKMPVPPAAGATTKAMLGPVVAQHITSGMISDVAPPPPSIAVSGNAGAAAASMVFKTQMRDEPGDVQTENLGAQTMQGITVQGARTTRTIPAGQIGNDRPIEIVTEVWTSPELQTIVYSKRSDPRVGEQIFQLTNIVRSEPDQSLFSVPPDFKLMDGPTTKDVIFYRSNE